MRMLMIGRALGMAGFTAFSAVSLLAAQAPPAAQSQFCLRGQPLRSCRSYLVFEVSGANELRSTSHQFSPAPEIPAVIERDIGSYLAWTIGGMVNRDSAHAVGVAFQAGPATEGARFAVQGRWRTWLPNSGTFDVAVGGLSMPQMTPRLGSARGYGLTAESAVGVGDQASVFVSGDLVGLTTHRAAAFHVGGRLGSYTGMAATAITIAGIFLLVSAGGVRFD